MQLALMFTAGLLIGGGGVAIVFTLGARAVIRSVLP